MVLTLYLSLFLSVISIRVLPTVLLAGQSIRITCVIPQRPENRKLVIAVEGYKESEYQLDGEASPGIFQRVYDLVPCDVEAVSCTLVESSGKTTRAALPVYVSGCDQR